MTTAETVPAMDIGSDIGEDNLTPEVREEDAPTLAALIAEQLRSLRVLDGRLVQFAATVEDGGRYIALDVTRIEFHAVADTTARVLLHLSDPVPAAAAEDDLLELIRCVISDHAVQPCTVPDGCAGAVTARRLLDGSTVTGATDHATGHHDRGIAP